MKTEGLEEYEAKLSPNLYINEKAKKENKYIAASRAILVCSGRHSAGRELTSDLLADEFLYSYQGRFWKKS